MEKRFTLALVLCVIVLVLWQKFMIGDRKPPPPKEPQGTEALPSEKPAEGPGPGPAPGPEAPAPPPVAKDDIKEEVLENDRLRLVLTNLGAGIKLAELRDYHPTARHKDLPLKFMVPSAEHLHGLRLDGWPRLQENPRSHLGESLWEMSRSPDGRTVVFKTAIRSDKDEILCALRKEITLPAGDARHARLRIAAAYPVVPGSPPSSSSVPLRFRLLVTGGVFQEVGGSAMTPPRSVLHAVDGSLKIVPVGEVMKSLADAKDKGGIVAHLRGAREAGGVVAALQGSERSAADLSNYLGAFLLLRSFPQVTANVHAVGDPAGKTPLIRDDHGDPVPRTCTVIEFEESLQQGAEEIVREAVLYLGTLDPKFIALDLKDASPAEVEALGSVYEDQLGWASFIGKIVLWALNGLHDLIGNWGWAIVALTFCVRLLLFPINRRSQMAMIRHQEAMAKIKPKLEVLQKKYEKDRRKYAEEQMKLLREEKVPIVPLGGCLPILLQIPIFFGLFAALRASIDLRQAPWLWVQDLSQPDHLIVFKKAVWNPLSLCSGCCGMPQTEITGLHLLPLLMTGAWFLNSWIMPRPATNDPQMEQQRKMMLFMPVLFGLMMYGYAAGLSLYWLTSSLVGIFKSQVIKKIWPPVRKP